MNPCALPLVACLLLAACVGRRHAADWMPGDDEAFATARASTGPTGSTASERGRGAAPGDERGPGGFVPRKEARSFYAASGGQLWYYLNLYYWAPEGADPRDLWIKAEVVEEFRDLRRWPDATPATGPARKTTVEYWAVGASGRTLTIDNHKDFFLASEGWCAGAIGVTITLTTGHLRVRDATGAFGKPRVRYVVERRSYGAPVGVGEDNARFEPLGDQPVTVWAYEIPWSTWPAKLVRSGWESVAVPEIRLVRRIDSVPVARAPVVTTAR